jgi:hypothetical protein
LTLTLFDSYNNMIQIPRSDLTSRSLLSSLEFVSTPKLPELLNLTITATKINEICTLETTIVVQRGAFAVVRGSIMFTNGQASYSSAFAPINPQNTLNVSQYTASTKVSQSDASQTFQFHVVLSDDFSNARSFSSNELIASGFPGSVKVPA